MKWFEFAGPPGVGKSALDSACARHFLRPSAIKSQSLRVTAEWRGYFAELDQAYWRFPAVTDRFRNGLFRDIIRAATMCINKPCPYLYSQFLTQHALRLARLYGNTSMIPALVGKLPEKSFGVILCYAPADVLAKRNRVRGHGREDQGQLAPLYLEATYALEKSLRNFGVPVLVLQTTESIAANKARILAFKKEARHA